MEEKMVFKGWDGGGGPWENDFREKRDRRKAVSYEGGHSFEPPPTRTPLKESASSMRHG